MTTKAKITFNYNNLKAPGGTLHETLGIPEERAVHLLMKVTDAVQDRFKFLTLNPEASVSAVQIIHKVTCTESIDNNEELVFISYVATCQIMDWQVRDEIMHLINENYQSKYAVRAINDEKEVEQLEKMIKNNKKFPSA